MDVSEEDWQNAIRIIGSVSERNLIRLLHFGLRERYDSQKKKDSARYCLGKFGKFDFEGEQVMQLMATAIPTPINLEIGIGAELDESLCWGQCPECLQLLTSYGDEVTCPNCNTIAVIPETDPEDDPEADPPSRFD